VATVDWGVASWAKVKAGSKEKRGKRKAESPEISGRSNGKAPVYEFIEDGGDSARDASTGLQALLFPAWVRFGAQLVAGAAATVVVAGCAFAQAVGFVVGVAVPTAAVSVD
jgi:hypothetical protein